MKNIIFSTTRQWNPGDEIILKGVIKLLRGLGIEFNPIIFNRNPDIRGMGVSLYKSKARSEDELWYYTKSAMMDNSVKPWTEYENIDAIVFAGTPEWYGWRSRELYVNAIKYQIPVFFIGIDTICCKEDDIETKVIKKAKFISVRNKNIEKSFDNKGILTQFITCPSILVCDTEKIINKVHCIGLIYRGCEDDVTFINGWGMAQYRSQNNFFDKVISEYNKKYKIIIICHYIDELYLAQRDFPSIEIRYSYDSADYIEIYKECDLVIGSRVHGIGICASMGIPSIPVKYDDRGGTIDGFYPNNVLFECLDKSESVSFCLSHIREMNKELIAHKKEVYEKYQRILKDKLNFEKVNYDYNLIQIKDRILEKESRRLREIDEIVYDKMIVSYINIVLNHLNQMIEGKKIIIKGGGEHTRKLLKYLTDKTNIVCIVDNDLAFFNKYDVIRNDEICNMNFDYVLISSRKFEKEMINEMDEIGISDKILSLYRMVEDNFIPIYQDFYCYLEKQKVKEMEYRKV